MAKQVDLNTDIAIVGGGLAGMATALALAGSHDAPSGLGIVICERQVATQTRHDLRASALTASSVRMLQALRLWPALEAAAQPVRRMIITDGDLEDVARPPFLTFDTEHGAHDGADAAVIVENGALHTALREALLHHPAVTLLDGVGVSATEAGMDAVVLCLTGAFGAGERAVSARLCVAADGARSPLRAMAGIKTVAWDYDQWGLVATIELARDHGGVALQHFLPTGPFAMLPLRRRRASLVWSEPAASAARLVKQETATLEREIAQRLGRQFGALKLLDRPQGWPLSFAMARQFFGPRLALVGDAAHRVHPLAGQGFNLGLKDAAALADCVLDAARLGLDIASSLVLERYQRWRRFDAAQHAVATDALNRLFSNGDPILRLGRDVGLGLIDRLPQLKVFLVREAAGDTGTPPRLLRGEAA